MHGIHHELQRRIKNRASFFRIKIGNDVSRAFDISKYGGNALTFTVSDASGLHRFPFRLNALGQFVRLQDLWQRGPLVLVFYRGEWCPYCNLELRAWQQQLSALKSLGASLVAVSPQTPDNSMTTAEKHAISHRGRAFAALAQVLST